MPENIKYKNNLQKLTETVVSFVLPGLIVLVGLGMSYRVNSFLINFVIFDSAFVWKVGFLIGVILLLVDTILFGKKTNAVINRLVSNLGKITFNSIAGSLSLILLDYTCSQYFNAMSVFVKDNLGNINSKQNIFWLVFDSYQALFAPVFAIILIFFGFWILFFVLRYFRVFSNHNLQNVLINSFIHRRGYKPKIKTVRQKIQDISKIQAYNKAYNSNYNNFTKYDVNLPTNKDFTFDYLEIKQYSDKTKLAAFDVDSNLEA